MIERRNTERYLKEMHSGPDLILWQNVAVHIRAYAELKFGATAAKSTRPKEPEVGVQ